jgi:hypothetical protein
MNAIEKPKRNCIKRKPGHEEKKLISMECIQI